MSEAEILEQSRGRIELECELWVRVVHIRGQPQDRIDQGVERGSIQLPTDHPDKKVRGLLDNVGHVGVDDVRLEGTQGRVGGAVRGGEYVQLGRKRSLQGSTLGRSHYTEQRHQM